MLCRPAHGAPADFVDDINSWNQLGSCTAGAWTSGEDLRGCGGHRRVCCLLRHPCLHTASVVQKAAKADEAAAGVLCGVCSTCLLCVAPQRAACMLACLPLLHHSCAAVLQVVASVAAGPHTQHLRLHALPLASLGRAAGHGESSPVCVQPCADTMQVCYCCLAAQALLQDDEAQLSTGLLAHAVAPAGDGAAAAAVLPSIIEGAELVANTSTILEVLHEVILPVAILLLGVSFSVAALWAASAAL